MEGTGTAADFYGYTGATDSYNGPIPTVSDGAISFLYSDTTSNDLSFGIVFDQQNDGSGGDATATIAGIPTGASWTVQDDPGDTSYTVSGGAITHAWNWVACCTDGGMLGPLDGEWTMSIALSDLRNIDSWGLITGEGTSGYGTQAVDLGSTLYLSSQDVDSGPGPGPSEVPEPASMLLLGSGLAGLVGWRARQRRDD